MLIALSIGIIFGTIQLLLLIRFATMLTDGILGTKGILFGILQFIMPALVLIGFALLRRQDLIWAAIGMVAALLIGAIIKLIVRKHSLKGSDDKDV